LHIACFCPEMSGHLNPTMAIANELRSRGHRVCLIGLPDGEPKAAAAGIEFHPVGIAEFPRGSVAEVTKRLGELSGRAALKYTVDHIKQTASVILRDASEAVRQLGVDGAIVDQIRPEAATVADHLKLPYVSLSNALTLNRESGVPPALVSWSYRDAWWARLRNQAGWALVDRVAQPVINAINAKRTEWDLHPYRIAPDAASTLAEICQQPSGFDFPRKELTACFHYVGPLTDARARAAVDFPYERLNDQPMVYASMGTLQNQMHGVFLTIAEACEGLPVQLVMSLGTTDSEVRRHLPDWPIIVEYAPQLELLKRAALTVTHAGLNTTLESLANGVPMVAIPVTNDQPAVAARIAHTGVGEFTSLKRLSAAKLRRLITRVLETDSYRQRAQSIHEEIAGLHGPSRAAEIVEQAITTGQPVLR